MTNYGRGRGKRTAIHTHRIDSDRRTGSLCSSADQWSCVTRDVVQIVNCKRCLAMLSKESKATETESIR